MNPAPLEAVRDNQTQPDADTHTQRHKHPETNTLKYTHIQYEGTCAEITVLPGPDTACNTTCNTAKHVRQDTLFSVLADLSIAIASQPAHF